MGHQEHQHSHEHGESGEHISWWKPAVSLIMLAAGIVMSAVGVQWFENNWIRVIWYILAFLPVGIGVIGEAVEAIREGEVFNEFMLMSIAALGAFAIGEYPEAVAVMVFYCIGEALQDRAVGRARRNIQSLVAIRPDHATVISADGSSHVIDPSAVQTGDVLEVKAGERVPVDGKLLDSSAAFDTAALTGESVPRVIEPGDEVLAGMIVSDSVVRLQAIRPASQSAVSRILTLVEDATERKSPTELFIRRFARVYTPVVVGIAALLVLIPWLMTLLANTPIDLTLWIKRALIFLVISCPCALVISVPLSYFAGIGAASRRGILFKGSNYLDTVAHLDTVVFDKTGTLTTGHFAVSEVSGLTDEHLGIVAAIEASSTHPIARAIVESHPTLPSITITQLTNIAGYGLSATVDGTPWLVGTTRLLKREGIDYPQTLDHVADTLVACAANGRYLGHILLSDTPKADAQQAVSNLKQCGVESVILSGDKQELVNKVARQLGVNEAFGDLLPQGKVEHIEQMQANGQQVAFVGDGINDAPVLALSNVGIAMGGLGSDMAIETADVVIQTDQPSRVAEAIAIGQRTGRIVKQNIIFAIAVKVLVMVLGVLGIANMWEAVFADVGVALLCVLNAMRLMRH